MLITSSTLNNILSELSIAYLIKYKVNRHIKYIYYIKIKQEEISKWFLRRKKKSTKIFGSERWPVRGLSV